MADVRWYPALDVRWGQPPGEEVVEALLAALDDFSPSAVDQHELGLQVFFATASARDDALDTARVHAPDADCQPVSISDEAWAERSQASLTPVTIGRITVAPPWAAPVDLDDTSRIVITILPSMGFGTGHHASTRLCLGLMQTLELANRTSLDVGTGSGVLAIAAARLGAARVVAIDYDPDALASAAENVSTNPGGDRIQLLQFDLTNGALAEEAFDLVTANLTGAMLIRHAEKLAGWVRPGGALVVSGVQLDEEADVLQALHGQFSSWVRADETDWAAIRLNKA